MKTNEHIKTFLGALILAVLMLYSYGQMKKERDFNPMTLNLLSSKKNVTLNELKENKIVLLEFGFLSCPDICPTTLNKFSSVFKELTPRELEKISFVFVDLDPERDTLIKIKDYTSYFHPNILGVSIPLNELELFTKYFGIAFIKVPLKSAIGYTIDHSTDILIIAPTGEILEPLRGDASKSEISSRIKSLLSNYFKI
jgi:protein SCO1/2